MIFKQISGPVPSNYRGNPLRIDTVGLFLLQELSFRITDLYIHKLKSHRRVISDLSGEVREKFFYRFGLF